MKNGAARRVLDYIATHPTASLATIAKACGCSRTYASEVRRGIKGQVATLERGAERSALWAMFAAGAVGRVESRSAVNEADRLLEAYDARWGKP